MTYDVNLVNRVREYIAEIPKIEVEEKEMFNVLNFMVNGKTCICISGQNLMLRFDPKLQEELSEKDGYETMLMKGKEYKGYCYINPDGYKDRKDFEYFVNLCLEFNKIAKSSKKQKAN
ncbi:TfoX/Sxy family protein [Polaribacter ponticola]|uniref:TfoX/Sxy family protein n=1 Tax=Polaribacter ponticola TaxID=2978475 RepID=A0ABT5S4D3_9FLAO|nr:TfoX/Sxy family protein [Polaribacter sp. MSW5]MDD7912972.1 TfoX/Sxy family protein [Polaribacter sp. MSW5]